MDFTEIYRLLKFGIVGSMGMLIDFGITWLLKEKLHWNRYAANGTGFSAAVLFNFTLNRIWTFRGASGPVETQLALFVLISLIGLGLNTAIVYLGTRKKVPFYLAKLIAVFIVFIWNYTANSYLTFRK
jgi:putative flippase GtrA